MSGEKRSLITELRVPLVAFAPPVRVVLFRSVLVFSGPHSCSAATPQTSAGPDSKTRPFVRVVNTIIDRQIHASTAAKGIRLAAFVGKLVRGHEVNSALPLERRHGLQNGPAHQTSPDKSGGSGSPW